MNIFIFLGTSLGGCFCPGEHIQKNHSGEKQKSFTSIIHCICVVVMKEDKKNYGGKRFQSVR